MTSPITFLSQTWDELKKVTWPKRDEVIRLTAVVIAVSVGVGVLLGSIDYVFTKILEIVIK